MDTMNISSIIPSLMGGAIIGLAATMMLLFNGRVTGISGILSGSLAKPNKESFWRWMFLAGMIVGGLLMQIVRPDFFINTTAVSIPLVIAAGFLVGYGTVMGSGCTSGHGVCGISRFSVRSLIATITFILFGFFTVQVVNYLVEGKL